MRIFSVHCPDQVIDLASGGCDNGNTIQLAPVRSDRCAQSWHHGLAMEFQSMCCMDKGVMEIAGSNMNNGAEMHLFEQNDGWNQEWAFYHVLSKSLFRLLNPETGKVIAPADEDCGNIVLKTKDVGDDYQLFRFSANGAIVNDKCGTNLDLDNNNCSPGANVKLSERSKHASQRFGFDSSGRISPNCPGTNGRLHLTVSGDSSPDGPNIELGSATGGWEQEFIVDKIFTPPILPEHKFDKLKYPVTLKSQQNTAEGFLNNFWKKD